MALADFVLQSPPSWVMRAASEARVGDPVVSAVAVSKRYGEVLALEGLDLTVAAGEVHGLVGANGAGKSTVLSMLLGLIGPDSGALEVCGRPVARRGASFAPGVAGFVESPAFYPYLSARQNLGLLARLDRPADGWRVEAALHRVGLAEVAGEKVRGFSLGMRQRLGIAAALLGDDLRLLVLDEPTNGLDPAGRREVAELLGSLADAGVAVMLSSHQITEVEQLCHAVTIMHVGRVVLAGSRSSVHERAPAPEFVLHTDDDAAAIAAAGAMAGVGAISRASGSGVRVIADRAALDAYTVALGRQGIAVRGLEPTVSPLEALMLALTAEDPDSPEWPEPVTPGVGAVASTATGDRGEAPAPVEPATTEPAGLGGHGSALGELRS